MFKKLVSSVIGSSRPQDVEGQLEKVLLARVPFLKGADRALLSELAAAIEQVKFSEGDTVFREGEPGDSLFLIVEGSVLVTSKEEVIAELGTGGCFGEGALLKEDGIRGATVVAQADLLLYQLKRDSCQDLLDKYLKVRYLLREMHEARRAENIEHSIERHLLESAPFLKDAGSDLINELAELLDSKRYAKGDVLIREGEEGTKFFLVEDGIVGVSKANQKIAELGPGACIGEGALFTRRPCTATVTALVDTTCFSLTKPSFNRIVRRYPVFARRLKEIGSTRHRSNQSG